MAEGDIGTQLDHEALVKAIEQMPDEVLDQLARRIMQRLRQLARRRGVPTTEERILGLRG
jgi:hypothetical protein